MRYKPVIPSVSFIRYVTAVPIRTVRSLEPTSPPCSSCPSHSQVNIYSYTLPLDPGPNEFTIVSFRYSIERRRPSQTTFSLISSLRVSRSSSHEGLSLLVGARRGTVWPRLPTMTTERPMKVFQGATEDSCTAYPFRYAIL